MYPNTSDNNSTYNIQYPFSSSSQYHPPNHISIEDGTIFNELLRQDNLLSYAHNNHNNITNNVVVREMFSSHDIRASLKSDMVQCGNNNGDGAGFNKPETSTTRKRVSKNDRHSKIITAQGPRDRRMRLSLDVAKRFFMLQDILGFDKASETVNWLLINSKSDIQELLSHHRSSFLGVSNSASCELLTNNIDDEQKANLSCSSNLKEKKRASRGVRKSSYLLRPLAKETREMARKRARDRTVEKTSKLGCASGAVDQFSNIRPCLDLAMNQDDNLYESWIINQPENISSHFQFKQGYIGNNSSSSMTDNWNPSFLINYQPNGEVLPHEHQLN